VKPVAIAGAVLLMLAAAGQRLAAQDAPAPPPVANKHELLHKYVWSTLGPEGALRATLASGFEQWRGAPPEWGGEWDGYAKRWVSEYAESAVGDTTKYAAARLLHHDPSFTRCECTGVGPRFLHAVIGPFVARTREGRSVWSPATVAGLVAGEVVPAATWYPAPRGTRDGLRHAAAGVFAKMGVDVIREFIPRRPRP
jgi:hypothetical protein